METDRHHAVGEMKKLLGMAAAVIYCSCWEGSISKTESRVYIESVCTSMS